jgi:hypothetical protein
LIKSTCAIPISRKTSSNRRTSHSIVRFLAPPEQNLVQDKWIGGKILKISPDGKLLHVFEIFSGDGTTNVAFSEGEKELYVTVVKDPKDSQAKGSIVKIANVK